MNAPECDAMVIGNHEFDLGRAGTSRPSSRWANFALAAELLFDNTSNDGPQATNARPARSLAPSGIVNSAAPRSSSSAW